MNTKRALFTIIFVLSVVFAYSKDIVKLYVYEQDTQKPLFRANVLVKGQKRGTATDKKGFFELSVLPKDSLKISYIGYESKTLLVQNLRKIDTVFLPKKSYEIENITVVTENKTRSRTKRIGVLSKRKNYRVKLMAGSQMALFIQNPFRREVVVKKLYFQLEKREKYSCDMRLRLLERDKETLAPKEDLCYREIIVTREELKKKNTVDIEKYNIFLPKEGVFFVLEWVGDKNIDKENDPTVVGHISKQEVPLWLNYREYKWEKFSELTTDYCEPNFSMEVIY